MNGDGSKNFWSWAMTASESEFDLRVAKIVAWIPRANGPEWGTKVTCALASQGATSFSISGLWRWLRGW